MLQWMGGGRRKVKTTRKSVEARQRHFFEQRRQKLRSEVAEPVAVNSSQRQEKIYSLDIASLKNLSRLAQEAIGTENFDSACVDRIKKSKLVAEDDLHGGNEPMALEATFDAVVGSKRNAGTQWIPASAAAAAATGTISLIKTTKQSVIEERHYPAATRGQEERKITTKIHLDRKQKVSLESKQSMRNEPQLTTLETNAQQQNSRLQGNKKMDKNFAKLDILEVVCGNEMEDRNKKPSCELYATSLLEGVDNLYNCTLDNEIDISTEEMDQGVNSTYESKVPFPMREIVTSDCSMMLSSACTSGSLAIDPLCQYEASNLGENSGCSIFPDSTDASYASFNDIDVVKIRDIDTVHSSGITGQQIASVHDGIFGMHDSSGWIGTPSLFGESFSSSGQDKSMFTLNNDISVDQPERNIFSECDLSFMTTCNFEVGSLSSRPMFEQLTVTAEINTRNPEVESVLYPLSDDDEIRESDVSQHAQGCNTFNSLDCGIEEGSMMDMYQDTASTSAETCLKRTDNEGAGVAVIDHFQTWIMSKKPNNCGFMFSSFFKRLDDGRDNLICDPKVSASSINTETINTTDCSAPSTGKESLGTSSIFLPEKRACREACYLLEYRKPAFKVMVKENQNSGTCSPPPKISQENLRNPDIAERVMKEKHMEITDMELTGDSDSHATGNKKKLQTSVHEVNKKSSNTIFSILTRLQKPIKRGCEQSITGYSGKYI